MFLSIRNPNTFDVCVQIPNAPNENNYQTKKFSVRSSVKKSECIVKEDISHWLSTLETYKCEAQMESAAAPSGRRRARWSTVMYGGSPRDVYNRSKGVWIWTNHNLKIDAYPPSNTTRSRYPNTWKDTTNPHLQFINAGRDRVLLQRICRITWKGVWDLHRRYVNSHRRSELGCTMLWRCVSVNDFHMFLCSCHKQSRIYWISTMTRQVLIYFQAFCKCHVP